MQGRLKKNEKSLKHIQNGLMQIKRIRLKKGQRTDLSQPKKIQNIVKNILKNKKKQIKNNTNQIRNILTQVKKERGYLKKD